MAESFDLLQVDVGLTEKGETEYMKVLESVYMYINNLKKEGIKDYVFEELKYKNQMDFNNQRKLGALETAVDLSRKMNFNHNETDIMEINRKPFLFETINKDDILNRLNLMKADNMYAIFHSKNHKKIKDLKPSLFQTEKWYTKSFMVEVLSNETIKNLNAVQKPAEIKMGYPPQNKFMP